MAFVFFSYCHTDEDYRDRLDKALSMLKRQGLIEGWHDRRIIAGDEIDSTISEALERADIVLLLVSPDFLASQYCYHVEMTRALARHESGNTRVIPIIVRTCDWLHSPLGKLRATPKDGKPIAKWPDIDDAFQDVVNDIRTAVLALKSTAPVKAEPTATLVADQIVAERPRSSNLRLSKHFTEADKDRFLTNAFEFIAKFFEGSLKELEIRNPGIETVFRRVDANQFTAVIYKAGAAKARCKITLDGMFGRGISYSHNDQAADNAINESLSIEADDDGLFLKPLGMAHMGTIREQKLTFEGSAEYYWSMLISPLQ